MYVTCVYETQYCSTETYIVCSSCVQHMCDMRVTYNATHVTCNVQVYGSEVRVMHM